MNAARMFWGKFLDTAQARNPSNESAIAGIVRNSPGSPRIAPRDSEKSWSDGFRCRAADVIKSPSCVVRTGEAGCRPPYHAIDSRVHPDRLRGLACDASLQNQ